MTIRQDLLKIGHQTHELFLQRLYSIKERRHVYSVVRLANFGGCSEFPCNDLYEAQVIYERELKRLIDQGARIAVSFHEECVS